MGGTRVKALVLLCLIVFCAVSVNGKISKGHHHSHGPNLSYHTYSPPPPPHHTHSPPPPPHHISSPPPPPHYYSSPPPPIHISKPPPPSSPPPPPHYSSPPPPPHYSSPPPPIHISSPPPPSPPPYGGGGSGGTPYGQNGNYTGFGLRFNYYAKTCPLAESLVTAQVQKAFAIDNTIIGGLIRMLFHDCFVRGCDASVLLDGIDTEKTGAPNANSLRGFDVIDNAKTAIENVCPGVVSCADIIAYAARDSIELGKGVVPFGLWLGGRKDGSVSIAAETLVNLPAPFFNYAQLKAAFAVKGLSEVEMVTLSGAHTVGKAHCANVLTRLYNFDGNGNPDPSIDPTYVPILKNLCPQTAPGNFIPMDQRTPAIVDVNYVQDVLNGRGLFISDNALRTTANGTAILKAIDNNVVFDVAFVLAMLKLSVIEVKTGSAGNIRVNCSTTVGAVP